MDKKKLVEAIRTQLENDITALKESVKATIDAATNEESKAENEYDTRGLEASYLARGQAKRIADMEEALLHLKHLNVKSFGPNDPISSSAVIEVGQQGTASK
ncbi:hypothetical protein EZJ49_13475 [Bdellovibrio bacteriovorus]|uniref:hypothetical protein n=1 Tax=Bdellovibrio bacteriovorus TaxID=959 RepID=UPI0021CE55C0|nr:hypothetical protein [Bdellovibrio bacteriovorus]UXR64073.1 hypothetical protein EZJ49_13475 [Bdellovibrio bacteriovorus]